MLDDQPPIATVVLHYRHVEDTLRCVRALRRSTHRDQRLVVVANDCTPVEEESLRSQLGATTLLVNRDNLGYAAGNNVGIRYALDLNIDLVWLVNPDAIVAPTTAERLVQTAVERPDAGVIGALITYHGRTPETVWCNGGRIDWARGGATSHHDDGVAVTEARTDGPFDVDYVTGASMLLRREVLEDVGLLAEHWFLYFEETDYAVRVRRAGWSVLQEPRAQMSHDKRSTSRLPAPYYVYYFVRNRLRFATTVGDCDPAVVEEDLGAWIDAWRTKVAEREPSWSPVYERLVAAGLEDGRADVGGRRDDLDDLVAGTVPTGG